MRCRESEVRLKEALDTKLTGTMQAQPRVLARLCMPHTRSIHEAPRDDCFGNLVWQKSFFLSPRVRQHLAVRCCCSCRWQSQSCFSKFLIEWIFIALNIIISCSKQLKRLPLKRPSHPLSSNSKDCMVCLTLLAWQVIPSQPMETVQSANFSLMTAPTSSCFCRPMHLFSILSSHLRHPCTQAY